MERHPFQAAELKAEEFNFQKQTVAGARSGKRITQRLWECLRVSLAWVNSLHLPEDVPNRHWQITNGLKIRGRGGILFPVKVHTGEKQCHSNT